MSVLSDTIEEFIKDLMSEYEDRIDLQRNELAQHFNCAPSQINYGLRRPLPWLLTTQMNLRDPTSEKAPATTHGFSVWLSDRSSSFTSFPGE